MLIFEEYQTLLETHIERLITSCGCTLEEFQTALTRNVDGDTPIYLDIILGAADFTNFVQLMREYKHKINCPRNSSNEADQPCGDTGGPAEKPDEE